MFGTRFSVQLRGFFTFVFSGLAQISGKVRVSKAATGNTWIERIMVNNEIAGIITCPILDIKETVNH